jgi:DNA-binding transcriptional LysR family regulator
MRFTLRQLEYFLAAAEAGSVTEAAQNIPVAQSSVSAAIAQLEAALGVQLLIRHHAQGISPTAEGRHSSSEPGCCYATPTSWSASRLS